MHKQTEKILNDVNRAIIQFRGIYSEWSKQHNITYNEMLVFYTIRELGYCTQKQICDNYLLPRQTMNNVINKMRTDGLLELNKEKCEGREKAFSLTPKGEIYAQKVMKSLNNIEEQAIRMMGSDRILLMTELIYEYDKSLKDAMKQDSQENMKNGTR